MIQCAYCGRENLDHATHCHECGSDLHPKLELHSTSDETSGIFAGNPKGKRYWKLAAGSLPISLASIIALVAWGPVGHPVEWFLVLLPSGIASAIGMVAAVRCSLLCRGAKQHFVMGLPALAHLYILLIWPLLSGLSMGR
jgi:hypothetical protein